MPSATERITELRENTEPGELPYLSKSRVKAYVSNPRHFYYNYILGIRGEENYHMKKGTRIHFTFEEYYANVSEFYESNPEASLPTIPDDLSRFLPDDGLLYIDWSAPYIGSFISWELYRATEADTVEEWLPVAVEAEGWDDSRKVSWMGFADVIVPAASVPDVEENEGVVIVDFKTGSTPKEKYRNHGIYLEGQYYAMLFEDDYDVVGVSGYYPKNNDFVVSPLTDERRQFIEDTVQEIHSKGQDREEYEPKTGPLCKWGPGDDEQSDYYSICSHCQRWGKPTEKWDEFVEDVKNDTNWGVLLRKYYDGDDTEDSLGYFKWKAEQV